jgi:hypothetical protein
VTFVFIKNIILILNSNTTNYFEIHCFVYIDILLDSSTGSVQVLIGVLVQALTVD